MARSHSLCSVVDNSCIFNSQSVNTLSMSYHFSLTVSPDHPERCQTVNFFRFTSEGVDIAQTLRECAAATLLIT